MPLTQVQEVIACAIHSQVDRRDFERLVNEYPGLRQAEREDLLAIEQRRLEAYQQDHYSAEENMLRWGFEHSFFALGHLGFGLALDEQKSPDPARTFVHRFRAWHPPRSHSVREMADLFFMHLKRDLAPLMRRHPWLLELARMERAEVFGLYEEDLSRGHQVHADELSALFERSVGRLLSQRLLPADGLRILDVRHELPAIRAWLGDLQESGGRLDLEDTRLQARNQVLHLVLSRHPEDLEPRWYELDAQEARVLSPLKRGQEVSLEELAEAWAEGQDAADLNQLLAGFFQRLLIWLQRRYFLLEANTG